MPGSATNDIHETEALVPPQLPSFLANVFNLKPIVGNPSSEEVKLVHEAVRALNNFLHMPELRDTDLPTELSQHLFDIQMTCHRQKYPTSVLPNDAVYNPPTLPAYIPTDLRPIVGPPSNAEISSVHGALRMSESFANVPSIFDPDLHAQLSQHLFDIQLARHVQRSILKRMTSALPASHSQTTPHRSPGDTGANSEPVIQGSPSVAVDQSTESTEIQNPPPEQPYLTNEVTSHQNLRENDEPRRATEIMTEIRDTLKNVTQILVGTQNSLARGFNSSAVHGSYNWDGISHDLGAHSLINEHGEVPEMHDLPTFKVTGNLGQPSLTLDNFTENQLARYLQFYSVGEEMIDEGEELKIKPGMINDARALLSRRLSLNR
ncbi:unnamed protein product [Rhizoctonia solani]|uniref:Laminin domain protein n=1 Tax=Rhizoctonia solani TaxID=456999 RepID=A0A8H3HN87_9AGAM|nr:unnamed protein product [Rhizoctonia solani]